MAKTIGTPVTHVAVEAAVASVFGFVEEANRSVHCHGLVIEATRIDEGNGIDPLFEIGRHLEAVAVLSGHEARRWRRDVLLATDP